MPANLAEASLTLLTATLLFNHPVYFIITLRKLSALGTLKFIRVFFLIAFGFISYSSTAQEATVTAGGGSYSSTGSVSFSIGQPFIDHIAAPDGELNEGVQQPHEIYILKIHPHHSLQVKVFPNPTKEYITIEAEKAGVSYKLFDAAGQLIESNILEQTSAIIKLNSLSSASYFLKVSNGDLESTFQIIKN